MQSIVHCRKGEAGFEPTIFFITVSRKKTDDVFMKTTYTVDHYRLLRDRIFGRLTTDSEANQDLWFEPPCRQLRSITIIIHQIEYVILQF